jgi:hypothetical protein
LVRQSALELMARAKLWAIQNKASSSTVIADLRGKVEDLEAKLEGATEQTLELFTTATKLATKKQGTEIKLNNFIVARRRAAATLAVKRMQQAGLMSAWNVWTRLGKEARQMAVVEQRIFARVQHNRLAGALESWYDVLRAARREARAKAFALVLSGRRKLLLLRSWSSATGSAKWIENVMATRARLAESRARAQCQLLAGVLRSWDEFIEQESENSRASLTANVSKFVAC